MRVALTVADFLDRAATVYGHRTAVVDESSGRARSGRSPTRSWPRRARGMALALDELGVGRGERIAVVSQNSARLLDLVLRRQRVRTHPGAHQLPAERREIAYIVEHCGASVLLVDPELDGEVGTLKSPPLPPRRRVTTRRSSPGAPDAAAPRPWKPDEDATARSTTPRAPPRVPRACSSPIATAGSTRRPSAGTPGSATATSTAHAADVPLQRLGDAVRGDRHGGPQVVLRKVDGAEILRRIERARRDAAVRCPRGPGGGPRARPTRAAAAGRSRAAARCASSWPARRRRRRRSSGSRTSSAGSSSRSTGSPRPRRCSPSTGRRAEWDGRRRRRARHCSAGPAHRRSACRSRRRRRRGAGPLQPRLRRLLGAARGDGRRARGRLVPHRRRRPSRRGLSRRSPTARRT